MPALLTAQDDVFNQPIRTITDFKFGEKVASVFDDMVGRSVPFYAEIQRMIAELCADFVVPDTNVYDLGCSTGTTLEALARQVSMPVRFVGVDNSAEMLAKARVKLSPVMANHQLDLQCADLCGPELVVENASVVLMVLTMQFIRPVHREQLLGRLYAGLRPGGCLVIVEKVLGEDALMNRLFIKYYYEMKRRNGYTELEISQKREALENVLIPYRLTENIALLERTGFTAVETFFKWYNFAALVAVK